MIFFLIFLIFDQLILLIAFSFLIMNGLFLIPYFLKSFKYIQLQLIIISLISIFFYKLVYFITMCRHFICTVQILIIQEYCFTSLN